MRRVKRVDDLAARIDEERSSAPGPDINTDEQIMAWIMDT